MGFGRTARGRSFVYHAGTAVDSMCSTCGSRRVQYGYITPAFSGSPWCGEFNMGDEKLVKMVENGQKWVTSQMCHIPNA